MRRCCAWARCHWRRRSGGVPRCGRRGGAVAASTHGAGAFSGDGATPDLAPVEVTGRKKRRIRHNHAAHTSWQRTLRGGVDEPALFLGVVWCYDLEPLASRRGILSRRRQLGAPAPEFDLRRG